MRQRFALEQFDIRERLAPLPRWLSQILFTLLCLGLEAVARALLNIAAPGAAPFALIYPAVLIGTLFAGWQCGVTVLVISEALAWYFVLNHGTGWPLQNPADGPRMLVIALSGLIMVGLAETFRNAVQGATAEHQRQLEDRELLLRELDHRTKNNFTMVIGLIDIQRRHSPDEAVKGALSEVLARVDSFSRAHMHLYRDPTHVGLVSMRPYILGLGDALSQALTLRGAVTLTCVSDDAVLDRDRAVTIGLLINELVTNAAKHAFNGRETGTISVTFSKTDSGYRLLVEDDGVGISERASNGGPGGLGQRLVVAFVRQINGAISTHSDGHGTRVSVEIER